MLHCLITLFFERNPVGNVEMIVYSSDMWKLLNPEFHLYWSQRCSVEFGVNGDQ